MGEQDRRLRLLRDTGGGSAPSDDPDFTDPANLAAFLALLPRSLGVSRGTNAKLTFHIVGFNAAGVVLARGSAALDLVVYHQIPRNDIVGAFPEHVIDSTAISTTLNRKITIDTGPLDRFMIGFQNQATMPATLDRLRIFWRIE